MRYGLAGDMPGKDDAGARPAVAIDLWGIVVQSTHNRGSGSQPGVSPRPTVITVSAVFERERERESDYAKV